MKNSAKRQDLSEDIVTKIKVDLANGLGVTTVSNTYAIPYTTIREIKACNNWRWVISFLNDAILKIPKSSTEEISLIMA